MLGHRSRLSVGGSPQVEYHVQAEAMAIGRADDNVINPYFNAKLQDLTIEHIQAKGMLIPFFTEQVFSDPCRHNALRMF